MSTGKKVFIVILIIVVIIAIIATVIYFWPATQGNVGGGGGGPCTPYTQQQYDGEKGKCQSKCSPKLLIPFVGVLKYNGCMLDCKSTIPTVTTC